MELKDMTDSQLKATGKAVLDIMYIAVASRFKAKPVSTKEDNDNGEDTV